MKILEFQILFGKPIKVLEIFKIIRFVEFINSDETESFPTIRSKYYTIQAIHSIILTKI